jgi:hypothetical protein
MQHNEYCGGKIVRKGGGEYLQRLDSAGGSPDHDNVLFWHPLSVSHLFAAPYWTDMLGPKRSDGSIMRSDLHGKNTIIIIPPGGRFTPKHQSRWRRGANSTGRTWTTCG